MKHVILLPVELIEQFDFLTDDQLEQRLESASQAAEAWGCTSFAERSKLLHALGNLVTERRQELAEVISLEMGKLLPEALGEVDKCALACGFYADNAEGMLQDDMIETPARRSLVTYEPLGLVFAIMPWNFPLWAGIPLHGASTDGGQRHHLETRAKCASLC